MFRAVSVRSLLARVTIASAIAGGAVLGSATFANAGSCDPLEPSCNTTGGEWCVEVPNVDPETGDVIGYRNICEDMTLDWGDQTPTCEECTKGDGQRPAPPTVDLGRYGSDHVSSALSGTGPSGR